MRTHVIGAGLAGLAAALALREAGREVVLYESGPAAGGRCRSYFDRTLAARIDNGNHLLLSGNRDTFAYLDRLGARDTLGGPGEPYFPFLDLATGERWAVQPNAGRVPWWVFDRRRGVPGARLRDYLGLLALRRPAATATVQGLLGGNGLWRRLLEPLAIAALNSMPGEGSAALFAAVMDETLLRGGAACIPSFPRAGLSESFIDPALAWLRMRGTEIHFARRVSALTIEDSRVAAIATGEAPVRLGPADEVVLAVPPWVATALLPGLPAPDQFEAILNVHFRLEAAPGRAGFIGLVGGTAEWVFVKSGVVSVTISAGNRMLERPAEVLAEAVWRDVAAALAVETPMPPWRVVKEKRATFAATPAQEARRPPPRIGLRNLALAGDWTGTGLPATIEGAIRSGNSAAHALLQAE